MVTALVYACAVILLFPILFYWHSYSLWIATYYYFVPDDLRMGRDRAPQRITPEEAALMPPEELEQVWIEEALLDLEGDRKSRIPDRGQPAEELLSRSPRQ